MLNFSRWFFCFSVCLVFCPISYADWDAVSNARLYRFAPSNAIPERYIVRLKPGVGDAQFGANAVMRGHAGRVHQHFKNGMHAFIATLPESELARLRQHPQVLAVEPDRTIDMYQVGVIEREPPWGLDRIDQADRPLDGQYRFLYSGAGVTAYVVDSGIRPDHSEFSGRLLAGYSVIQDGGDSNDCVGHGTHVAGTLGGTVGGVAKSVWLVPVRVLDVDDIVICSGQESNRELVQPLQSSGQDVHVIGGADVATELDAKRAIDQAVRLAARL
jgi:subtilisin family serine protease